MIHHFFNINSVNIVLLIDGNKSYSGSNLEYSEVRVFLEQKPTVTTMYKSITTSNNRTISLSKNHLIYLRKTSAERFNPLQVYFTIYL